MNERTKRVNQAYRWLIWLGEVDDKLSFAQRLGKERANITNILKKKGDASDRFCGLILASFPGIFNRDWLLDGVGNMLATTNGLPTSPFSTQVNQQAETDTQEQRQSIIDLYAGLIKESESFRREIKNELEEVRNLRSELQQARDDFREATYRMTQFMKNRSESISQHPSIGLAAEPENFPQND
jgi:hypothetical protein